MEITWGEKHKTDLSNTVKSTLRRLTRYFLFPFLKPLTAVMLTWTHGDRERHTKPNMSPYIMLTMCVH